MPLCIRDDSADALARKVMKVTGAANKTEAVFTTLHAHLEAVQKKNHSLSAFGKSDPGLTRSAHLIPYLT